MTQYNISKRARNKHAVNFCHIFGTSKVNLCLTASAKISSLVSVLMLIKDWISWPLTIKSASLSSEFDSMSIECASIVDVIVFLKEIIAYF